MSCKKFICMEYTCRWNAFSYKWFCMETSSDTKAVDNSEMAYWQCKTSHSHFLQSNAEKKFSCTSLADFFPFTAQISEEDSTTACTYLNPRLVLIWRGYLGNIFEWHSRLLTTSHCFFHFTRSGLVLSCRYTCTKRNWLTTQQRWCTVKLKITAKWSSKCNQYMRSYR